MRIQILLQRKSGEGTIEERVFRKKQSRDSEKRKVTKIAVIGAGIVISIYLIVLLINIFKKPTSTFVVEEGKIYIGETGKF